MCSRNYSTRQHEKCAPTEAQPGPLAKAKDPGLHPAGRAMDGRFFRSSSCLEHKLPFRNSLRVCSWAGVKSVSFMSRVTDVKGTSLLQKSEETFQTTHAVLLVTNLYL